MNRASWACMWTLMNFPASCNPSATISFVSPKPLFMMKDTSWMRTKYLTTLLLPSLHLISEFHKCFRKIMSTSHKSLTSPPADSTKGRMSPDSSINVPTIFPEDKLLMFSGVCQGRGCKPRTCYMVLGWPMVLDWKWASPNLARDRITISHCLAKSRQIFHCIEIEIEGNVTGICPYQ